MEPYSVEFRSEVLAACDANEGTRVIAQRFKVSESWIRRIKQQRRETGQVTPKTASPRQPKWHAWSDWLIAKFVFIDETWAKTNMTRTYGRSRLGTRLLQKVPFGRWQTTTFLGALRVSGFIAPLTIDGPITGRMFRSWVEQHLAPVLQPGDIVVSW